MVRTTEPAWPNAGRQSFEWESCSELHAIPPDTATAIAIGCAFTFSGIVLQSGLGPRKRSCRSFWHLHNASPLSRDAGVGRGVGGEGSAARFRRLASVLVLSRTDVKTHRPSARPLATRRGEIGGRSDADRSGLSRSWMGAAQGHGTRRCFT